MVYEVSDDTFLLWTAVLKELEFGPWDNSLRFLDMGAGSGYLGFEALKVGLTNVTLVDVDSEAVAAMNAIKESEDLPCTVIESNLFAKVSGEFDIIVFNTPYLPNEEDVHDVALHGGPEGITVAQEFLKEAKNHLAKKGKIFLLASSLGNQEALQLYAQSQGYQQKIVAREKHFFEELIVYELQRNTEAFDMQDQKQVADLKATLPGHLEEPFLLHRGKRGVVFQAKKDGQDVVVKVLRPGVDARNTIHLEATYLRKANEYGVGPKLLEATDAYVIMEYVPGVPISAFVKEASADELRRVLTECFGQLRSLDKAGLNKYELTNPYKHIIINEGQPVMIDFERMRHAARPKNVTQFAQYLTGSNVLPYLQQQGVLVLVDEFHDAIKAYARGEETAFEQFL